MGHAFVRVYSLTFEYPRVIHHWVLTGMFLAFASSVGLSVPEQSLVDAVYGTCLSTDHTEINGRVVNNCFGLVWKLMHGKGLRM